MAQRALRTVLGGLIIASILVGCEGMVDPPETRPEPPSKPEQANPEQPPSALYREIDADQLRERWQVLPGGAVAAEVAQSTDRRQAAASEGFSGLPRTFRFEAAREYGACVVFTLKIDHRENGQVVRTDMAHTIDCPGEAATGNAVTDGLFHAAHMCVAEPYSSYRQHVLRAGDFDPATHVHAGGGDGVNARIGDHSGSFQWHWDITPEGATEAIRVNWAVLVSGLADSPNLAGFDTLQRHEDDLEFGIDHSTGVVDVESNDGAAWTEYQGRCATLPPPEEPPPETPPEDDPPGEEPPPPPGGGGGGGGGGPQPPDPPDEPEQCSLNDPNYPPCPR